MHKFGIIIGRFQPFHNAHREVVRFALSRVENLIIVLGSANQARTVKNPWTTDERINMIKAGVQDLDGPETLKRIEFVSAKDYLYNDNLWLTSVQEKINAITEGSKDVVLVGHKKDTSSFYLNLFPQWKFLETGEHHAGINATKVRDLYFQPAPGTLKKYVPSAVFEILNSVMGAWIYDSESAPTDIVRTYCQLKEEHQYLNEYMKMWDDAPFPPTFVTTDAVVIKSGHVLVVRRKGYPGKGLLALPGGFLNQHERIIDGVIRELKEETRIQLPKARLRAAIADSSVFDHPSRSLRGRTITHAFCINLGYGSLPKVIGSDDADKAWWMPLRDVMAQEEDFFEDHFHIINYFVNKF